MKLARLNEIMDGCDVEWLAPTGCKVLERLIYADDNINWTSIVEELDDVDICACCRREHNLEEKDDSTISKMAAPIKADFVERCKKHEECLKKRTND